MLMNTWSILKTIKVRMHCKHIRKPETNYPCCLWLNFPDWFLPHNVILFSQKFWCSHFSEFMCCLKCFPLRCTFWCFMITKCSLITLLLKLSDLQNVDLLWTYTDEHDRVNEGQTHWSDIDVFYICYGKGTQLSFDLFFVYLFAFVIFYCFVFLLAISHSILALHPECTVPYSGPRKHEIIPRTKHSMLLKLWPVQHSISMLWEN